MAMLGAAALAALASAALLLAGCGGPDAGDRRPVTTTNTTTTTTADVGLHCAEANGTDCARCVPPFKLVDGRCFFTCTSDLAIGPVVRSARKGLALDDTTLRWCSEQILTTWPNTDEPVRSMRMFKAWQSNWDQSKKEAAWRNIAGFVRRNDVRIMIGTLISCDEKADDEDWEEILQLLKLVGSRHVMGLAIGNEPELFWMRKEPWTEECVSRMWSGGYLFRKFQDRVKAMDSLPGFESVKVTTVFGEFLMGPGTVEHPFVEDPAKALVDTFIKKAVAAYGSRFVLTLNLYTYFDINNHMDPGSPNRCDQTLARTLCFDNVQNCQFAAIVQGIRTRMQLVSQDLSVLWIGETGWSLPTSKTLTTEMKNCPAWSAEQAFETYYRNFVGWDTTIPGVQGPDHVFYFTMRDSVVNGLPEGFGLVSNRGGEQLCQVSKCKLQANGQAAAPRGLLPEVPVGNLTAAARRSLGRQPAGAMRLPQGHPEVHIVPILE
mmetsp:Transcript_122381/g.346999  ORF Transcript_122381/g.346999 Transcript_122381/m.346999 type:complete len:490 (+) Transcript_122381:98-1567(+)